MAAKASFVLGITGANDGNCIYREREREREREKERDLARDTDGF